MQGALTLLRTSENHAASSNDAFAKDFGSASIDSNNVFFPFQKESSHQINFLKDFNFFIDKENVSNKSNIKTADTAISKKEDDAKEIINFLLPIQHEQELNLINTPGDTKNKVAQNSNYDNSLHPLSQFSSSALYVHHNLDVHPQSLSLDQGLQQRLHGETIVQDSKKALDPIHDPKDLVRDKEDKKIPLSSHHNVYDGALSFVKPTEVFSNEKPIVTSTQLNNEKSLLTGPFSQAETMMLRGLIKNNGGSMVLHMNPKELGRVVVHVETRGNNVQISMKAEHESTMQLLSDKKDQLQDLIQSEDLVMDKFHVTKENTTFDNLTKDVTYDSSHGTHFNSNASMSDSSNFGRNPNQSLDDHQEERAQNYNVMNNKHQKTFDITSKLTRAQPTLGSQKIHTVDIRI